MIHDYISDEFTSMVGTYISFIRVVPIALLAFVKDFGKRNSKICAYLQFALSLFIFVRGIVLYGDIFAEVVTYWHAGNSCILHSLRI